MASFGPAVGSLGATPASDPEVAGHVVRYVNRHEAVVSDRGVRRLIVSSVPLLASTAGRPAAPVDLQLAATAGGLAPVNPLQPVWIGSRLGDGVSVGQDGLRFRLEGADVSGQEIGRSTVFFGNVGVDTDAEVAPTATGAELLATLRSVRSPEQLRYAVSLPQGASLRAGPGGTVQVVRGSQVLATVSPPVAADAQGSAVPVSMHLAGTTLVVDVAHRSGSFAYPILVDPQVNGEISLQDGTWTKSGPVVGWDAQYFGANDPNRLTATSGGYLSGEHVQWAWQSSVSVNATLVTSATWALYNVDVEISPSFVDWGGIYIGDTGCQQTGPANLGSGGGTIIAGKMSGQWTFCGPTSSPGLTNQLEMQGGQENGSATSSFGAFVVTYTCSSTCSTWTTPTGSDNYGSENAANTGLPQPKCGHPVNCALGNQYEVDTDLSIPERGPALALTRTYNSQAAAQGETGPFGAGWSNSFSDHLTLDQTAGTATVTQANGSTADFTSSGSSFVPASWVHATLVQNSDGTYTYTLADQTSFHFDSSGRLISEADRNGEAITVGYNANGQLSTLTDGTGRSITLTYTSGSPSYVAQAADSSGRTVTYSYSGGDLVGVTDAAGGKWAFGYDGSGQLTSETDPDGNNVTTSYNSSNQVISQTDGAGRTRTWTYSPGETLIHNPDGTETDERFDGQVLTSITYAYGTPLAATTTYAYDSGGNVAAVTDPNGNVTSYIYDSAGNLLRRTDPLGRITKWTYDSLNDVTSTTDPLGSTTTFTYDTQGNLLSESTPLAGTNQTRTTSYARNGSGHPGDVTAITDPDGHTTTYGYDAAGDRTSVTDPLGNTTTYGYDELGRVTSIVSARGNAAGANPAAFTTTYTYNPQGQRTSETDPLGHTQTWAYDGDGNLTAYTDADQNKTTYSYDPDNELLKVTRADTTTLQNTYDAAGNLTSHTDGAAHTTTYGYDALEQLTSSRDPLNRTTTFGYDLDGNRTSVTDPSGRTTTYTYDADNECTAITYSDGTTPNVTFGHDSDGRRTSMSDGTGQSSYAYDSLGRLTSTTDGHGDSTSFGYDLAGNQTSITYPNGQTVTQAYDNAGQLTSVTDWLGNTTTFAWDPDSNEAAITFPSSTGNVDTNTYNDADQLTGISMAQGTNTLASFSYARDANGQVIQASSTGLNDPTHNYTYNSLNQLTAEGASAYGYDPADNPTTLDGTSGYTYDAADELTAGPNATYSYDQLGERTATTPTTGTATSYSYDQGGRLTSESGPAAASYTYDGDGLQGSRTTNGTTEYLSWDHSTPLRLLLNDGQSSYIYGPDGLPIDQISNGGTVTYLHHDEGGSTRLITDQNGDIAATYTYNSYGATISNTGTATTPLEYAGQYTDPATGLIYLRARWYDPQTAQFLTVDPLVQKTEQPYQYALDNPINGSDPSGLATLGLCWATNGTLSGFFGELSFCAQVSTSGEVGGTATGALGLGGIGGDLETGQALELSNAKHIHQLGGPFIQAGAGGALLAGAFGSAFHSVPTDCVPVYGGSIGPATGFGAGGYVGGSETVTASFNPVKTWEHFVSGLGEGLTSLNPFG